MYSYDWDPDTGGILLNKQLQRMSKEPRPVYSRELDLLGFQKYWKYEASDEVPYMWAEMNSYYYRGKKVAITKGGSCYTRPDVHILEDPEPDGAPLRPVNIKAMLDKNTPILDSLTQDTIKNIFNTYLKYKSKVDVFYTAFSGGKDSVVVLDLVMRALPHSEFKVLFGDTQMEFPDTYEVIEKTRRTCENQGVYFGIAKSAYSPDKTWSMFGPPSTSNRWCCSVHKTSPQILYLRELTQNEKFTGMAFTGIRSAESAARSEYETVSEGHKHQGQMSCHAILDWNSAELFLYIYKNNLPLNMAYVKGNLRAGCLVCPNSTGKHEYVKHQSYMPEVDQYLNKIRSTSSKTQYTYDDMSEFIDKGYWRTRKSGRELNFGVDKFEVRTEGSVPVITIYIPNFHWKSWAKTIGTISKESETTYSIDFKGKLYRIIQEPINDGTKLILENTHSSKEDIKFKSLMTSVVIKSIYCVGCNACVAECKNGCLSVKDGISVSDDCVHCYKCHNIHGHCLRYNSIRNKITEGKKLAGLDRYQTFGTRAKWLEIYCKYHGSAEFWESNGDGAVDNKKKDAFLNFLKDSDMVLFDRTQPIDKFHKYVPQTPTANTIFRLGPNNPNVWPILLCNLVYTPQFRWFITHLEMFQTYDTELMKVLLSEEMPSDLKGLGKRNVTDSIRVFVATTPLGTKKILVDADIEFKYPNGNERIYLNSLKRIPWENPEPLVILYSLYKYAEACDGLYQLTISRLLNRDLESEGVSPAIIFGIQSDELKQIISGLSVNYPGFIDSSFTLDLDNINLNPEKSSKDVLNLFS